MLAHTDVLVCFKEYPHTDVLERAQELMELCRKKVHGEAQPVASIVDCQMIAVLHTSRNPVRGFIDRIQALEGREGILSISIIHGFPWGDVADMGTKVLVYSDGNQKNADSVALTLANELTRMRDQLRLQYLSVDAALEEALAYNSKPVVLADSADNAGGGAPGDSTFILRRVLERGHDSVAIGPLYDPMAVRLAFEAGVGARLPMRIGGKVGPVSGDPVDAMCTVKALQRTMMMSGLAGTTTPLGDCALIDVGGVEVVLISIRCQGLDIDLFTQLGCNPANKGIVVVKSSQHFYASFSKIASKIFYVDSPGALCTDFSLLPYKNIQRPKWPL
jgi:microcystin degradation protein MlrC